MNKIYICTPYFGDSRDQNKALQAAQLVCYEGCIPIAPILYFPQILDQHNDGQRLKGLNLGIELLKDCQELWIVGNEITSDMELVLSIAREMRIPTELFDDKVSHIDPTTLQIDSRVNNDYRAIVRKLNVIR